MSDDRLFDHRPDPELGAALRSALEPPGGGDQAAFVARVMARYDAALAEASVPTWEVLARWARPGIAAAVVVAVLGGYLVGRTLQAPVSDGPATLETAMEPPEPNVLFASLVESR